MPIVDGAVWTLRLLLCDDVVIHGIRIHNDLQTPNSDAIDLDCCRRVHLGSAHDVRLRDCEVVWRARPDDARHALYAENCKELENRDFRGDAAHRGLEAVVIR